MQPLPACPVRWAPQPHRLLAPDRATFHPWFRADWRDVLFVHYAVDPALLQPHVPFDLDLYAGKAWVSLVAFTQDRMRPALGGPVAAALMHPAARHEFLNLRTYVRAGDRRAILFLAEWIPNRLALLVGPSLYGLPFRLGTLDYRHHRRDVRANGSGLHLSVPPSPGRAQTASSDSLDAFLLERYTAFTCRFGRGRRFDIAHAPWTWRRATVRVEDDTLIRQAAPWFAAAQPTCAHHSDGAFDVVISGPRHQPPAPEGRQKVAHGASRGS
jgi:hypothetical protein